ncbi:hypothetical protein [Syntrophothermus sp.]|uniref:hypothetical protein n=1 Tax=Syntrophothermus sp. TaxID=2736299 RepID=UPI00338E57DC
MEKGKVKMVFPGGNTCLGFYSFYDNIIEPDANRIFVIKGGRVLASPLSCDGFERTCGTAVMILSFTVAPPIMTHWMLSWLPPWVLL